MKSHYLTQFVIALSLLILSVQAHAAQWYHVELIVFEQLNTITDEQWPQMTSVGKASLSPGMATSLIQPAATETLLNTASRLNHSARYRVHYHNAWQQPIMRKNSAKSVKIRSANNLIEGTIRLYKSTYLHAALDLWLKQNSSDVDSWSDASPNGIDINAPQNPNLKESRRIRSKKLYFFDHPKLGALLQLTPIKTPAAVQTDIEPLETFSLPTEATPTVNE
ncbi:MAG: CsiV family protein [Methylophagaceae bacterium]